MTNSPMDGFRLSPLQQHFWSLRQAEGYWTDCAQCAVGIEGPIEDDRLREALRNIVARYEILRTVFPRAQAMTAPLQVIREDAQFSFERVTRPVSDGSEEASIVDGHLEERRRAPFDPSAEPPLRASLLTFSPTRHALLLTVPALCADGHSLRRILHELVEAYGSGGLAPGGPEPMQYAEIAEWQNALLEGEDSRAGRDYWRRASSATAASPPLPFERYVPPRSGFRPAFVPIAVAPDTGRRFGQLVSVGGAPLSSMALAAWTILMGRLTGVSELLIGCEEEGRTFEELRNALGPCARSLPLLCPLTEQDSFRQLAARIDRARLEQRKWQDYFTPRMIATDPRDSARALALGFSWQERGKPAAAGATAFRILRELVCPDRFELRMVAWESEGKLEGELQYDAGLFERGHIHLAAGQLSRLLESASRAPDGPIDALSFLGEDERRLVLGGFSESRPAPVEDCVHWAFEERARQSPRAVAVLDDTGPVSYAELDWRSDRIAEALRSVGVGPESVVGILADRTAQTVAALLGVLKAGGAYLPLDPSLPRERIFFLLADSAASVALAPQRRADLLSGFTGRRLIIEEVVEGPEAAPRSRPARRETGAHTAYVIYTSGSTGRPKGVAVEHRQLSNYVAAVLERLDPPRGASFAMVSTFAADLGHTALFPSLCSGGRLHVISEERAADAERLADDFEREPVDYLKIVPSHLAALLAASRPERVLPRKALILGGEPSRWDLIDRIHGLDPTCAILNHYGPTETTVGVTTHRVVPHESGLRPTTVPVGRALGGNRVFLLDRHGRPVPFWVGGELHVSGAGVARCYVSRPEATAESFLPDPFAPDAGGRFYATGDLARYLPDGRIELLGRTDEQIKVHGFRIEPGEIATRLREHASVVEAAVIAREDENGQKRLVAYVVRRGTQTTSDELRDWLHSRLPEFMVPSAFVFLDRLPRTPNGKLDRRALPEPRPERKDPGESVLPRTATERTLAGVWAEVLGLERVGIHENFFHLGGDSILGIQIIARAARVGLRISPRQLFQHQTVAELASAAGTVERAASAGRPLAGPVSLTPIQHWFFEQDLVDPHHYNQAILLAAKRPVEPDLLERAVAGLLEHHDALRLRFSREGGGWTQRYAEREGGRVFSHHDLSALPEVERADALRSFARELHSSLDLSNGPLARVVHFDLGSDAPGRLLLLAHHLAVDGISWRVLLEDLETAYRQLRAGQTLRLPPKTASFQKWAEDLAVFANSDEIESELEYWTDVAANPAPSLPVDRADGRNTVGSAREVTVSLDAGETRDLLKEVPGAFGTQINEVLVACLLQAFADWTGVPSLFVDMEGHGREALSGNLDLSRSVGWFTSRFPLFVRTAASADFDEAIAAVQEQLRRLPRRGLGFGLLRYLSRESVRRRLQDLPQPLVSFNYLGQLDRMLPEESVFDLAPESLGSQRSPRAARKYLLAIDGKVLGGQLRFTWTYGEETFDRSQIERVAGAFRSALQRAIVQARPAGARSRPVSEFPESGLTQRDLEVLIGQLQGGGKGGG